MALPALSCLGCCLNFCLAAVSLAALTASTTGRGPLRPGIDVSAEQASVATGPPDGLGIVANNACFYYADLDRATRFYTETLGIDLVADYDFAKILRLADTSYLTLVDATKGMHAADEPKTVTLALVTDDLEAWHAHVTARRVPLKSQLVVVEGRPHDGFVAIDPEGYFLEFERFNPHEENRQLGPVLASLPRQPVSPAATVGRSRPVGLGFRATVLWTYYTDLAAAVRFYEDRLGFSLIVDQGWAKIYRTSGSGFIGLVDQARGLRRATDKKGVTVSFWTNALDRWFDYVKTQNAFTLRSVDGVHDDPEGRYRAFVGYDPEGYSLEFDAFLPHALNSRLLEGLRRGEP